MWLIFSDNTVHALQFLDVIKMKDPTQKAHFYRNTLREALPFIPRVNILNTNMKNIAYEKSDLSIISYTPTLIMLNAQCTLTPYKQIYLLTRSLERLEFEAPQKKLFYATQHPNEIYIHIHESKHNNARCSMHKVAWGA